MLGQVKLWASLSPLFLSSEKETTIFLPATNTKMTLRDLHVADRHHCLGEDRRLPFFLHYMPCLRAERAYRWYNNPRTHCVIFTRGTR